MYIEEVGMKKQSGFTLIELVIVVVILGFLAVTAIPKFIDLTDQAKQANIEGMAGGFATGISLARAQWEAEGRSTDSQGRNTVNYDGTTLVLTTEVVGSVRPGYVTGLNSGGALGTGFTSTNCIEIWQNILQQPPALTNNINVINNASTGDAIDYFVAQSGNAASTLCHYYLKETLSRDTNGNYTDPSISTAVGNSFTYQPANSSVAVIINN
jgi:MSHA pilin protein MshB